MFNGKRETDDKHQEQEKAGTSSGGLADVPFPLYELGLYKNVVGYVK
jgi:hypothetical protein